MGVVISKRQVVRLLTVKLETFRAEDAAVLKAGLSGAYVTVDDTGARHAGKSGYTTQIGSSNFTAFRTGPSKSRLAFLSRLCGGASLYVINDAALDYMKGRDLSQIVIDKFIAHKARIFASAGDWERHLQALALSEMKVLARSHLDRQRGGAVGRDPSSGLTAGHGHRFRRRRPVSRRRPRVVLGSRRTARSQAHPRQRQAAQRRRGRQADDLVVLSRAQGIQACAKPRTGSDIALPVRPHL
jgi:hypothetical protein